MRLHQLLQLAVVAAIARAQYHCDNLYVPANYTGNTRVPPDCPLQTLACPASWKEGVREGQSTAAPLIDVGFVQCHEGFLCCGYVPISSSTGRVLGQSGVTVGSGVDLGSKTSAMLASLGVPRMIVTTLDLYFGLKRDEAACAVLERPFTLDCSDAQTLTEAVKNHVVGELQRRYDRDQAAGSETFADLPRGVRTAIADVWFQFGNPSAYPAFWGHVKNNDWENVVKELRDFYGPNANPPRGDLTRRNNEADILEAALKQSPTGSIDKVNITERPTEGPIDGTAAHSVLSLAAMILVAISAAASQFSWM